MTHDGKNPEERIAELELELAAAQRTIDVLIARLERGSQGPLAPRRRVPVEPPSLERQRVVPGPRRRGPRQADGLPLRLHAGALGGMGGLPF